MTSNDTKNYNGWDGEVAPGIRLRPGVLTVIAGPCMLESPELALEVATELSRHCKEVGAQYIFKSSFDKANRTSKGGVRGPGLETGLRQLARIKESLSLPVLTDIHTPEQAAEVAGVVDVLQIPAFLCAQRALLAAACATGRAVQIKKGQFSTAGDLARVADFCRSQGNNKVLLCERGSVFGYNNLVVDYRNLVDMRAAGNAVVFDATHAAQLPGAGSGQSSGLRHVIPALARASIAAGVDALFLEVHPNPDKALSDAATQLDLATATRVISECARLQRACV